MQMKYLVITILAIWGILFVGGIVCKVLFGWTWKKSFDQMFGWLMDI